VYQNFIISCLYKVVVAGRLSASSNHDVQQPFAYAKPEAASAVMLLMMGGVSPKTC